MAYSFHNQNMSTLSNVLVIHTALDKGETESTTAFTIPGEVMARVMKTGYGNFVVTNSIPCLRVVLADGTTQTPYESKMIRFPPSPGDQLNRLPMGSGLQLGR